ncbi:hypothetical protein COJ07_01035 [Bacillus cereus]|uniref:Transposase n=1 Tax=Bacillus cereus TaxID=1396 RepID=A0A2B0UAW5_BACCE|nr:hypothetical protein COJ07_01035 [Bacillus cereus]PFU38512.1 hypothetical protein COK86_25375 [Bacillus cereus]
MISEVIYALYSLIFYFCTKTKIRFRLFNLLQKNRRKSHRYEQKTVFDILGAVYSLSVYHNYVA